MRLANALIGFWWVRGHFAEGRERLATFLAIGRKGATGGSGPAWAALASALSGAVHLATGQGDFAAARALLEQSVAICRETGNKEGLIESTHRLGLVAQLQGDTETARTLYQESVAVCREIGNVWDTGWSLGNLGDLALDEGDLATARARYEESMGVWREVGSRDGLAGTLRNLGHLACQEGDDATARTRYEESLAVWRAMGNKSGIASSLRSLGDLACDSADFAVARTLYEQSLTTSWDIGSQRGPADGLEAFANLAAAQGQPERALCLAGAAAALRDPTTSRQVSAAQRTLKRRLEESHQALGEAAAAAQRARGHAMLPEEAIRYALEESETAVPR